MVRVWVLAPTSTPDAEGESSHSDDGQDDAEQHEDVDLGGGGTCGWKRGGSAWR